jgi:DNA-binding transcriptional MerR regulator
MKETTMQQLIKTLGVDQTEFSRLTGIPYTTLNHYVLGRRKISAKAAAKIVAKYPAVDVGWLVSGEGEMFSAPSGDEKGGKRSALPPSEVKKMEARIKELEEENDKLKRERDQFELETLRMRVKVYEEMEKKYPGLLDDPEVIKAFQER